MGSVVGLGGGKTGSSSASGSSPGNVTPLGNELENLSGGVQNIAGQQVSAAQPFLQGGESQYEAGLTGELTPAQQALQQFTTNEMGVNTANTYANLGLGGSTMETQDQNANALASLANENQLLTSDELLGMQAAGVGGGFLNNAVGSIGEAGQLLGGAENVYNSQQQQNQQTKGGIGQALGALSGNTAGTSGSGVTGTGSLFSGLSNLWGSGGSGKSSSPVASLGSIC